MIVWKAIVGKAFHYLFVFTFFLCRYSKLTWQAARSWSMVFSDGREWLSFIIWTRVGVIWGLFADRLGALSDEMFE
jgi:hypothetical protein